MEQEVVFYHPSYGYGRFAPGPAKQLSRVVFSHEHAQNVVGGPRGVPSGIFVHQYTRRPLPVIFQGIAATLKATGAVNWYM